MQRFSAMLVEYLNQRERSGQRDDEDRTSEDLARVRSAREALMAELLAGMDKLVPSKGEAGRPAAGMDPQALSPGLYRLHWVTGGSSLAAVGILDNGDRWMAPINWVAPSSNQADWLAVARAERLACK